MRRSPPGPVVGVDEAGRGPLAGPVVAAAVVLGRGRIPPGVRDSKALGEAARERLAREIRASALGCGIGVASVAEIDRLNILQASLLAMARAVRGLVGETGLSPRLVLVDGDRTPPLEWPARAVVKGDRRARLIGAASILAKVARDQLMRELDARYPEYGFARHKGYGSREHLAALARLGPCTAHRRSYAPVQALLESSPWPAPGPGREPAAREAPGEGEGKEKRVILP